MESRGVGGQEQPGTGRRPDTSERLESSWTRWAEARLVGSKRGPGRSWDWTGRSPGVAVAGTQAGEGGAGSQGRRPRG